MNSIQTVCVFCGSSFGDTKVFTEDARKVGSYIAQNGMEMVFGGGNVGLMGECAKTCLESGGRVTGVIPQRIHAMVGQLELSELYVVETMHERKSRMYEMADCFIALPGGIGTIEELFEVYTWAQLGYLAKPVGILNSDNYYTMLIQFLDSMAARGFLKAAHRQFLKISDSVEDLFDMLKNTDLTYVRKL